MLVIDTNIWVSYTLNHRGTVALKLQALVDRYPYAFSNATFRELNNVLLRNKFDPYFSRKQRVHMLKSIARYAEWFNPVEKITDCPDPMDNAFLELAITCNASAIITGDQNLLIMDPYKNIRINTIAKFSLTLKS